MTFIIDIAGVATNLSFQEISGLDVETQVSEYRPGGSSSFSTIKTPGLQKSGNVTLKRGVFANDKRLIDWLNSIRLNRVTRSTITIRLLDERRRPTMTWTLANAWPTKIASPNLSATGNEVAVETLELAYEGLTIAST
jgi:phage tail-like protein